MSTTASTLITRTLDNLSRSSSGTTRSGATMTNTGIVWLNKTLIRISRKHDFREMFKKYSSATVVSQKSYDFPDNFKVIISLTLIDGFNSRKLTNVYMQGYDKKIPYPENYTTGIPAWYIPFGTTFDLYKIPDAAYTLYCRTVQWPTTITATTDTVDYATDKDDIIVAGMTREGFRYLQMYEDSGDWDAEYKKLLQEAIDVDTDRPDYVPVAKGFDSGSGKAFLGEYWNDPFVMESGL